MLTEFALRNLKPRTAAYKIADRDGMYVAVSPAGTISFRYDYRINGRRETLTIGRYGRSGFSLALAREKLLDARRAVLEGKSPAVEKQREKQRRAVAKTFGEWAASWLDGAHHGGHDAVRAQEHRRARYPAGLQGKASFRGHC